MAWVAVLIALISAVALWAVWVLRLNRRVCRLGETDLSNTIFNALRSAPHGASIALQGLNRQPGVVFTKLRSDDQVQVQLTLIGDQLPWETVAEFRKELEGLGIPFTPEQLVEDERNFSCRFGDAKALEPQHYGRIADLALAAVGLKQGDEYLHTFRKP